MKKNIICDFVFILAVSKVTGLALNCLDGSTISQETNLCECEENLFYNAYEGKCQGVCDFFSDKICGDFALCAQLPNATEYECQCSDGYYDDGTGSCIDENQCGQEIVCEENEECLNQDGGDICICTSHFFRNEDGVCEEIDYCIPPDEYPCDQSCTSSTDSASCSCYTGYTYENGTCVLDDGYEECSCGSNPDWAICREYSSGEQLCDPKPGFQFVNETTKELEDINECLEVFQCPRGSECVNKIGYYSCQCKQDYIFDTTVNECVQQECSPGFSLFNGECKDLCDSEVDFRCPTGTVCLVNEHNVASCECQLECNLLGEATNSTFSIYTLSVLIPNKLYAGVSGMNSREIYDITKSFESIFGKGNAQIIAASSFKTGSKLVMNVGVLEPLTAYKILEGIVLENCWSIDSETLLNQCVLPAGLIIAENHISATMFYPCTSDPTLCASKNANCTEYQLKDFSLSPGRYRCDCIKGYEIATGTPEFYCIDTDECKYNMCSYSYGYICMNLPGTYECVQCCNGEVSNLQYQINDAENEIRSLQSQQYSIEYELEDEIKQTRAVGYSLGAIIAVELGTMAVAGFYLYRTLYVTTV